MYIRKFSLSQSIYQKQYSQLDKADMCFRFEVTAAASIVLQLTSQRLQGSQRKWDVFFNFLNLSS